MNCVIMIIKIRRKNSVYRIVFEIMAAKNAHKFIIYKHKHTSALQISTYYHNLSSLELYSHTHFI